MVFGSFDKLSFPRVDFEHLTMVEREIRDFLLIVLKKKIVKFTERILIFFLKA